MGDSRLQHLNRSRHQDYWNHPPPRWKNCPKVGAVIEGVFLPFKTPLDAKYDAGLAFSQAFHVEDVFDAADRAGKNISAWLDLTKSFRFYQEQKESGDERRFNAHPETKYLKISCDGHDGAPSEDSTRAFIDVCDRFIKTAGPNKKAVIGVHCTHGFNRTGFLICAYLIEKLDWSVDAALRAFADARPPGIYKEEYIKELYRRYDDVSDAPSPPDLPEWCYDEDNEANPGDDNGGESGGRSDRQARRPRKDVKFMEGVPNVVPEEDENAIQRVRTKIRSYCHYRGNGFPGCQPVSMDNSNKYLLEQKEYWVSWKADGVRYMLYIESGDDIFFLDRNDDVFRVSGMYFPSVKSADGSKSLTETLLDGEMIFDLQPDGKPPRPRYLVYDIIHWFDEDTGLKDFVKRSERIQKGVIDPRNALVAAGRLNKDAEPFSIRWKLFVPVINAAGFLSNKFSSTVSHEVDGLVFQPLSDPYLAGRCDLVLKWKPPELCTVDFKLKITRVGGLGEIKTVEGLLFVTGEQKHFGKLKNPKKHIEHDGKVIECSFDKETGRWVFHRVRTDKNTPNHITTADSVFRGIRDPLTKDMLLHFINNRAVRDGRAPIQPGQKRPAENPPEQLKKMHRPADEPRVY